ncbi:MAG: penicillin-binding protein 2 [Spirochaetes bacterium]|nr:penicillin-binding protein 2 [Spirochaetota bacterium]
MQNGERRLRRRFFALTVIFVGGVGLLALYLFSMQIVRGGEFKQRAKEVSSREAVIPAQRGEVFDRSADIPLVFNVDSFAVDLSPAEVPAGQLAGLLERLAAVLSLPLEEVERRVPEKTWKSYQPVEVRGGVPLATVSYLAEHRERFPGVTWRDKPVRNYLEAGSLAHVIGYVGDITREELQVLYNRGYDVASVLGKSGIERQYDEVLRGRDGKRYRRVDVQERRLEANDEEVVTPTPGLDIVLTIDRRIQKIAEQALGNRRGSVVVLRPSTGEVLALVSYPSFDPNRFFDTDGGAYFTGLAADPSFPFLNRAIQSVYPPASTFKMVLTTAAVEERSFPLTKTVRCTGKIDYGDRTFNCWKKEGHGYLDLMGGLAQSCDVFFWTLAREEDGLGVERIVSYAREFGLGAATGIDLPEERVGLLPTPEWKEKTRHTKWVGGDTLNIAIGQGDLTVSPMQMANMVALIANGGTIYKPHLLKETRDPVSGAVIERVQPEVLHSSRVSKETWAFVQEAMRGVITKGTAAVVVDTPAVEVAGKTGTSETGVEKQWHSWFAAYAPFKTDKPEDRVVVVTMVEASENWEWWAPKAANLILHAIFSGMSFEETLAALKPWYAEAATRRIE